MKKIKLAYVGGGSKEWAYVFMNDLALAEDLGGEIALYDIDLEAAKLNQTLGRMINNHPETKSQWDYEVYADLDSALQGADFVAISILPGTFQEMESDVHAPEAYGIYQTVGDTTGPGGVLRSMRTVPIYEEFARAIKRNCPSAWVLNFTNPMSICVQTLYDVFPEIKAFGCCHEVFHTQNFLCRVLFELKGVNVTREEIFTDVAGINHFTWVTEAKYQDIDLLGLLKEFMEKFPEGCNERGAVDAYRTDPFQSANLVKLDLFRRYGVLGAAGDRHLVEFMNPNWYLKDPEMIASFKFARTSVSLRIAKRERRIQNLLSLRDGKSPLEVKKSTEEAVDLIQALLGRKKIVSNVNLPNQGQMPGFPQGAIVETNAVFSHDSVRPVVSKPLPPLVQAMVLNHLYNLETLYQGIKTRDLQAIFRAFLQQPLCANLRIEEAKALFRTMIEATKAYLEPYFAVNSF
jgi:alpha-galactosidase/6-phospho-beta-glucosidase family protein